MITETMLYLEPKDDETYAIMKYIEKYVEYFFQGVVNQDIISNSRSMFPRLRNTNKRGQQALMEVNKELFEKITNEPFFHDIFRRLPIENGFPNGFNLQVLMLIKMGNCKVENFKVVLHNPPFSFSQNITFWNNTNWSCYTEDMGTMYGEFIEGILDHTEILNEDQIDNPLSNSENIINLMDNLDLNENDYKNILKYIINKI